MVTRTSGRAHREVNYNEKGPGSGGGGPAWARELDAAPAKENSRPSGPAGGKKAAPPQAAKPGRKSAPAVAQKGRDAGLERLPIEDAKPGSKSAGAAKARPQAPAPAAGGKQVLPGVFVKGAGPAKAAAPAKPAEGGGGTSKAGAAAAAAAKPAAKSTGSGGRNSAGAAAAAKSGSGGKRKAAAAEEEAKPAAAPAAKPEAEAKRHKAAPAPQQQRSTQRTGAAAAAVAVAAAPAPAADLALEPPPGSGAEELVEHFSANFRALQAEYARLQALYEDLKAAKIDEEVQQLLEQQNRHVGEHGQKAAALVDHYKAQAEQAVALAAELGGEALAEQCRQLQADLMTAQQALLDKENESLEKDRQLAAQQARLAFLERFARVYETSDKCIQTDPPPRGEHSAQFPSLQSSGVEMLQAHALVPEGAAGGSIYKRPKAGGPPVPDTSYTLPRSPLPPGMAVPAAGPAAACSPAAAATAGGVPLSGSDMQLTGADEQQPAPQPAPQQQQQQQQQARRQSLQPVAGRMAHAAAGPAPRPASAESQINPAPAARPQQRRQSMAPSGAAPTAAAGGNRRVSAPPAPVDRELRFSSTSTVGCGPPAAQQQHPPLGLEAVPEEEAVEEAGGMEAAGAAGLADQAAPAASQATAAGAGPLVRVTLSAALGGSPASVPPPPRDLALFELTGMTATPLRGGIYQYADPRYGYVFQLGPASPDSAALPDRGEGEAELCYRPIALGAAGPLLPPWFHEDLKFVASQRNNFFIQMMDALANK